MTERAGFSYEDSGVDYKAMDPFKRAAIEAAMSTARNLERFGYREIGASRGESAFVWDEGDKYRAIVTEGLGTKNLVADAASELGDRAYYFKVAQDTVAMIVNDLVTVGDVEPQVITAHFSVGSSDWFDDQQRAKDLLSGYAYASDLAGATWGGGETPTLKDIVLPGKIELSGTAMGEIRDKQKLRLGEKLGPGDAILLIGSSGIHANGLTLAREIAKELPDGYATRISDGTFYGDALLAPTHIYTAVVHELFENGIDIHYMANITGHGWRKLMRANKDLTYRINYIPEPQPIFDFIQERSHNSDEEMYGNFNMGAGYALMIDPLHAYDATHIIAQHGFIPINAGKVEEGSKRVIIEPKDLIFEEESLNIR